MEELLAERGVEVDHATVYRWVQRFHSAGDRRGTAVPTRLRNRWFVNETYVKITGRWSYVYRTIDQFGQVIDVLVSEKRDLAAIRRFFSRALGQAPRPVEVTTDQAQAYPRVLDELLPSACHVTEKYANNPVESDHGRLGPGCDRCVA